jgi:hypothetical protein
MTKKSDKPDLSNDPRVQLFVYGLDEAGKPKGARFAMAEMETVSPVVTAQKLQFFKGTTEELANLGMKLAVGRIYARGKSLIPNIKRDLYDKIQAEVVRSQNESEASRAEQVKASPAASDGGSETATAPTDVPAIQPPLPSGLPQNWESIAVGNMVLADEGPGEGFWQAIVIARDNEILTLRYRDYPKVPKFERHISTIALINPRPA